jgi:hypothetical protein
MLKINLIIFNVCIDYNNYRRVMDLHLHLLVSERYFRYRSGLGSFHTKEKT